MAEMTGFGRLERKEEPDRGEDLDRMLNPLVRKWFYSRFSCYSLPQRFGLLDD